MAHVLKFRVPKDVGGVMMDRIYNVSQHVGPGQKNQSDDVRLVQLLLREFVLGIGGSSMLPTPQVTGALDDATALWVYYQQLKFKKESPTAVLDGIVSPARGVTAYNRSGDTWYIIMLNFTLKADHPKRFDDLQNDPFIKTLISQPA
jgi:hypothetical protein